MWEIYIFNLLLNISHKIFSFTNNVLETNNSNESSLKCNSV